MRFGCLVVRWAVEISDEIRPGAVVVLVGELGPAVKEYVTSGVKKLRKESEGRGVATGEAKGARLALLKRIASRYGAPMSAVQGRALDASDAEADRWLEATLTAPTLDTPRAAAPPLRS